MTQTTTTAVAADPGLGAFLAGLKPATALRIRTLAHAWTLAGGTLAVGRLSIRLLGHAIRPAPGAPAGSSPPYTAGTLHARGATAALELSHVLLEAHGLGAAAWQAWCDERPDLRAHGFEPQAKFPSVRLDGLGDAALVRLALGLRDLALAARP